MKDAVISCFCDILEMVKNLAVHERHKISDDLRLFVSCCSLILLQAEQQKDPFRCKNQQRVIFCLRFLVV